MTDPIFDLIAKEKERQENTLMMIPSENYTYPEVREAVGSVLIHKYAEGYPGKRYYQGMEFVDKIENIAIDRVKNLFKVPFANVQPYSGSPANTAVYFALLSPGDTLMGLSLSSGGHLTHGHDVSLSGKYFKSVQYEIETDSPYFNFEKIRQMALENKPKIIVVGTTAFPRTLPWEEFSRIADEVGAYLMADISHIAGLVAGGAHPSPVPHVHIVTTTTHKTLRGPRGALIMVTDKGLEKDPDLGKKINRAVFPGLQGGPHLHTIAGIAITAEKASQPEFKDYAQQVVKNAQALAQSLIINGFNLVTGGTDNHLLLVDLQNFKIDGKTAAEKLEAEGLVMNKNSVQNDPNPPARPSGIRMGTPGMTTRGMKEPEMQQVGEMIKKVLIDNVSVKEEVLALCPKFPVNF
jgi:glycine hydroxymethyltransferase